MIYSKEYILRKLLENSHVDNNGCRLWDKGLYTDGYGKWKDYRVHRLAAYCYGILEDINDTSILICHKVECKSRKCFAENHIYAGTNATNWKDTVASGNYKNQNTQKTHCKNGHEFTPENITKRKNCNERVCRKCAVIRISNYRKRKIKPKKIEAFLENGKIIYKEI